MMGLGNEMDDVGERENSRGPGGHLAFGCCDWVNGDNFYGGGV